MSTRVRIVGSSVLASFVWLLVGAAAWAAPVMPPPGTPVSPVQPHGLGESTVLGLSPFSNYTAGVAIYLFFAMILVLALLFGGFLVVNISLMSKRPIDRGLGGIEPSDVGILRGERFYAGRVRRILPPEEDPDQPLVDTDEEKPVPGSLHEEDMRADSEGAFEKSA